jgi:hypothetical protein
LIVVKTAGNSREAVDFEEGHEEDALRKREVREEGLKECVWRTRRARSS